MYSTSEIVDVMLVSAQKIIVLQLLVVRSSILGEVTHPRRQVLKKIVANIRKGEVSARFQRTSIAQRCGNAEKIMNELRAIPQEI